MSSATLRAFGPVATAVAVAFGALTVAPAPVRASDQSAEPPVGGADSDGEYLRLVHQKLHGSWVDGFIRVTPYDQLGPATSTRETELNLTIRWDGTIEAAVISKPSGSPDFDAAALNAIWMTAPFPPPATIMADDGLAHLKWRFARDHRLCSGAEVVHVEFPLAIALPNLLARGLLPEAAHRMSVELERIGWGEGDFVSPFVRQWLARPNLSDDLDTRAAAALAVGGDRRAIERLKSSLRSPVTAALAAPALHRVGINVGALLAADLATNPDVARRAVVAAIRAEPAVGAQCEPCVAAFAAAAFDPRQPIAERVAMVRTLGDLEHTQVVELALGAASKDPNSSIRAAGLLAAMQPGRGRVGIILMAPLLHDRDPELRAAAAAGVLRAGGDQGLVQLYLLARERDPRPLIAAAGELGKMTSADSATLLGKWLKRPDKAVRRAAIQALAARHDETARTLVDPILSAATTNSEEDPAVRELALRTARPDQVAQLAATDPLIGRAAYRALIAAEQRQAAARWLLAHLAEMSAADRIAVMGEWIATSPRLTARN
jgi:TonB family protein